MTEVLNTKTSRRDTWLVIYRSASDVAAKGAMFIVTVVAARRLSHEEFGIFALASTLGWLGAVVADFGLQLHVARSVAQHPDDSARLLARWLPVRLGTGALALAGSLWVLRLANVGSAHLVPAMIFAAAYTATGLAEFQYYLFRGMGRSDIESTLTVGQRTTMCVLAIAALWWRADAVSLAIAMFVPAAVTAVVATGRAYRLSARPFGLAGSSSDAGVMSEMLSTVAPLGLGIVLSAMYFRIDVFLLERWTGTQNVALYSSVFRLVDALRLFPAALLAVVLPRLCRATDVGVLIRLAAPLTAAAIGMSLVLWLTADLVVGLLYGPAYAGAAPAFRPLLLSFPLMTLNFALTHQLIGWQGQRAYAAICGAALVLNVAMNAWLIPSAGIVGAAWSTVWTELFLGVCCLVALGRAVRGVTVTTGPDRTEAMVTP